MHDPNSVLVSVVQALNMECFPNLLQQERTCSSEFENQTRQANMNVVGQFVVDF
jgi:hypothetical protein